MEDFGKQADAKESLNGQIEREEGFLSRNVNTLREKLGLLNEDRSETGWGALQTRYENTRDTITGGSLATGLAGLWYTMYEHAVTHPASGQTTPEMIDQWSNAQMTGTGVMWASISALVLGQTINMIKKKLDERSHLRRKPETA